MFVLNVQPYVVCEWVDGNKKNKLEDELRTILSTNLPKSLFKALRRRFMMHGGGREPALSSSV